MQTLWTKWIEEFYPSEKIHPNTLVCHWHFAETAFKAKHLLTTDAVPSIYLQPASYTASKILKLSNVRIVAL